LGLALFFLGIATVVAVWAVISFAVPIITADVAGLWPFQNQPEGKTSWGEIVIEILTFFFFVAAMLQWGVTRNVARLTAESLRLTAESWLRPDDPAKANCGPISSLPRARYGT
jgi:hypothetical protein